LGRPTLPWLSAVAKREGVALVITKMISVAAQFGRWELIKPYQKALAPSIDQMI
jgi:hypothetical protein